MVVKVMPRLRPLEAISERRDVVARPEVDHELDVEAYHYYYY